MVGGAIGILGPFSYCASPSAKAAFSLRQSLCLASSSLSRANVRSVLSFLALHDLLVQLPVYSKITILFNGL